MCAGYLFQPDKQYDVSFDTGDKAIQCGRHVDIFKFWLMWKAKVRKREFRKQSRNVICTDWQKRGKVVSQITHYVFNQYLDN